LCQASAVSADVMVSNADWERGRVKAEAAERARVSASLDAEHSQSATSTVMTD